MKKARPQKTYAHLLRRGTEASAFDVDLYELTAGDYKACVDASGCSYNCGTGSNYTYDNNKDNHPINYVNWQEAVDYCTWKGKRLPTEFEWEKAARGTDGRRYPEVRLCLGARY